MNSYFFRRFYRLRRLEFLMFVLQCRMRLLEFFMRVRKAHIICLQRGYLQPYECNLVANFWLRAALSDHPVKCINVFFQSHIQPPSNTGLSNPSTAKNMEAEQ